MIEISTVNADCMVIMPELDSNSVDLILTDIPYDVVNRQSGGLRNLNKGPADNLSFSLEDFLKHAVRIMKGSLYIFCSTEQVSFIRDYLVRHKLSTRHCIWEKTNPSPMNGQYIWLSSIENCVFAKKPKATFNERCKSCVWKFSNGRGKIHPTEKPLALFEYLINVSSNKGDWILDPCMGSGTTGVVCKKLNRNFIGVELNKEYFDLATARISQA